MRIDPLTAQDAMSRYLLVCDGLDRPTGPEVKRSLERAFREYGLPRVIRTDNGPPFASVGLGSLTPLMNRLVSLSIPLSTRLMSRRSCAISSSSSSESFADLRAARSSSGDISRPSTSVPTNDSHTHNSAIEDDLCGISAFYGAILRRRDRVVDRGLAGPDLNLLDERPDERLRLG